MMKQVHGSLNDAVPVAGTMRNLANLVLLAFTNSGDYEIETDLNPATNTMFSNVAAESEVADFQQWMQQLNQHCSLRGKEVSATITNLPTYLSYLNATPYTAMVSHTYADLTLLVQNLTLPKDTVYHPGISPDLDSVNYPSGMGLKTFAGAFAAGAPVNAALYADVNPLLVVTADFTGGTAAPVVVVAGTDSGGATTTTWSPTGLPTNPVSAVSTTMTAGGPITPQTRTTVTLASGTGIVPGSVLTFDGGTVNQEAVIVEAMPTGTTATCVFQKAHANGCAVTGKATYTLTPSVAGRRCRSISNITVTMTGHVAGAVRVDGRQDRRAL
jgi:hypothetical protein